MVSAMSSFQGQTNPLQRARFYGILDTGYLAADQLRGACKALLAGGADIIQLRAKKQSVDEYRAMLQDVLPVMRETDVPLIINDSIELALEFTECGLHLGQDDLPIPEARKLLGPDRILGLSTHSVEQAEEALKLADLLTYFCIGPVFPTQTKPDYIPVGLNLVTQVTQINNGRLPLFCIGGITRRNVHHVRQAGGDRVVVVSDVLLAEDQADAVRELRAAI